MEKDTFEEVLEKLKEYDIGLPPRNIIDEFIDDELIKVMEEDANPDCC